MAKQDFAVEVHNISKTFTIAHDKRMRLKDYFLQPFSKVAREKFTALNNIKFDVTPGEFVGIIGRNGSGKSTLLKMLARVYIPDKGSVAIHGKLVPFLELGVGFNPELTGKENVYLNGTILGMTKKDIAKKYNEIVQFAEIEQFMDTQLKHYSSGMQVRLAFAIAIQAQGDIYLLDEVLAVGDAGFQIKSKEEILKLKNAGKTIIFVSHDHDSIQRFADKVVWIKDSNVEEIAVGQKEISSTIKKYLNMFAEENIDTTSQIDSDNKQKLIEVNVKMCNDKNLPSKIYQKGDALNIILGYKILQKDIAQDLIFGISISNENGMIVYGTNTGLKNIQWDYNLDGKVIFSIPKLQLLNGTYYLTIGAHAQSGKNYMWDDKEYIFNVISDSSEVGLVGLETVISLK